MATPGSFQKPILDHIVILTSQSKLLELPEKLKDTLVVAEGGTHADGLTTNRLILFQDGTYIELIAFVDGIDPEKRKTHRWGQLEEDRIIDWACSLHEESDFKRVQERVVAGGTGYTYHDPVAGGRIKPDGTELKWAVASGRDAHGKPTHPGSLPFWCLDRTDRRLRVPYEGNKEQTSHPSGVRGVSLLTVTISREQHKHLSTVYSDIFTVPGKPEHDVGFTFAVPNELGGGKHAVSLLEDDPLVPTIQLSLLKGDAEKSPVNIELLPGLNIGVQ